MAVRVDTSDGLDAAIYAQATKWVIDDYQQLHVVGPDGNIASYSKNVWSAVHHMAETELEAQLKAVA